MKTLKVFFRLKWEEIKEYFPPIMMIIGMAIGIMFAGVVITFLWRWSGSLICSVLSINGEYATAAGGVAFVTIGLMILIIIWLVNNFKKAREIVKQEANHV